MMADSYDFERLRGGGMVALWLIGRFADRHDSERLRGFSDGQMDICNSRVAFATEKVHYFGQICLEDTVA